MPNQESDPRFSRDSIANALKNLNQLETLGEHPLSQLRAVRVQRMQLDLPDSPRGRGTALQQVLLEHLDALKPAHATESATGEPDPADEAWHTYYILEQAFVQGKSRDFLADTLGLGQRQYFRRQADALDELANRLWQAEQSYPATTPAALSDIPRIPHFVGRADELAYFQGSLGFRMTLAVDDSPRPTYGDCRPL